MLSIGLDKDFIDSQPQDTYQEEEGLDSEEIHKVVKKTHNVETNMKELIEDFKKE